MKILKTTDELITHLKNKGCRFTIVREEEAKVFLETSSYYMKLASFRANYDKIEHGPNAGKYKNLEFAYLKELSIIDMKLRYMISHICADIEHSIRTKLVHDVEQNTLDDGYRCVGSFIGKNIDILKILKRNEQSEYCKALTDKYYPYFPVWVFVELISFGTLASLCNHYNELYNTDVLGFDIRLLNSVRDLRNASAHHNCLLVKLRRGNNSPLPAITQFVSEIDNISKNVRSNHLSNKFKNDFTTLLYVYKKAVESNGMREKMLKELKEFTDNRLFRHYDYFKSNNIVKGSFEYMKKIVDYIQTI